MKTKYLISNSNDPFFNLALEEWCLRTLDTTATSYLLLYVNKDAVVVGRNQNIFEEVNIPYCRKNNIEICRRVSGGGTVFHDMGNLNWTFIAPFNLKQVNNYKVFAEPIITLIKSYKLDAYLTERNAIEVAGVKLSGQAQFTNRKSILSHGTLLVHSDLERLQPSIEIDGSTKIKSKAAKSVRSTTANLASLLGEPVTIEQITSALIKQVGTEQYELWDSDILEVEALQKELYQSDKWIYGKSPKSKIEFVYKAKGEEQTLFLEVAKGKVVKVFDSNKAAIEKHVLLGRFFSEYL